jgi:4-amino-4-deoxy-L-arabinose transferase-like glycosyltransferase
MWWGAVVFLAVAGPWYVAVMLANPDYGAYFFIEQNFGNFSSSEAATHPEPWHFYIPVLIGGFFPWIAFLPATLANARRRLARDEQGALVYLGLWVATMLLFFSVASSKLPSYLMPLFPALAILVAVSWRDLFTEPAERLHRQTMWALALMAVILTGGFIYAWFFELPDAQAKYKVDVSVYLPGLIVLIGGFVISLALVLRRMYRSGFAAIVAMVVVLVQVLILLVVPAFNPYRTTGDLGRRLDAVLPEGEPIVCLARLKDSVLFYTPRLVHVVKGKSNFRKHMGQEGSAHAVVDMRRYETFNPKIWVGTHVVDSDGGKVVLANRTWLANQDKLSTWALETPPAVQVPERYWQGSKLFF